MKKLSFALTFLAAAAVVYSITPSPVAAQGAAKSNLTLDVYTSNDFGYGTTSTIVYGANEAILLDPNFLARDAAKVAAKIKASGKKLTTIYTTHAHPDHFFGAAVLTKEFPNARYVALPEVAKRIPGAWPNRRTFWLPTYGNELPGETPVVPEPLAEPKLTIEGETLEITGEVVGDGPGNSYVWIPSLRAIVAGDVVFYERHLGAPADPTAWFAVLDKIDAMKPEILVPGHKRVDLGNDPKATQWMRQYITDFNTFKSQSKTGAELKAKVLAKYPKAAVPQRLDQAVDAAFPPAK